VAAEGTIKGMESQIRILEFDLEEKLAENDWKNENAQLTHDVRQSLNQIGGLLIGVDVSIRGLDQARRELAATEARGFAIQAEREVFRKRSAAIVQGYRTRDLAFRVFRNEALEKYKTLFDLSARYTFLAARAYDYETGLLDGTGNSAAAAFYESIVQSRALGVVDANGNPQFTSSDTGDPGLAGVLAAMAGDWSVAKTRLGFNNPDRYRTTFSLRKENFRIIPGADGDKAWKDKLDLYTEANVLDDPDVRRYCMQIATEGNLPVPGLIIPFQTTITRGANFFGWPLASGDGTFSPTSFATKIRSSGIAFNGYFKFALVDDGATQTFWTNDGTASGEPAMATTVAVSKGHYAILLGETQPIPAAIFAASDDIRLRVWFSGDNVTFSQLTPDRRITPAGYAFSAGIAASLAPGYETGAGPELVIQSAAAGTVALDATFGGSFAVPLTVSLGTGWSVDSTSGTGFSASATFATQTIDPGGQTGSHGSLAVINGRPAVAYRDDDGGKLFYIRSVDASGTSWPPSAIVRVDGAIDSAGQFASLAEVDGRPAISYYANGDLRYVRANDAAGMSWPSPITIDGATSNVGRDTSLALIGGKPAIAYQSPNTGEILYAWADDAAGTSWNTASVEGSIGAYRQHSSLVEVGGKPAIALTNQTDGGIRYAVLTGSDPATPGDWTVIAIDSVGKNPSLAIVGGQPAIAYDDGSNVRFTRFNGTSWVTPTVIDAGIDASLADIGGVAAISYYDNASGDLKLSLDGDLITVDGGLPVVGTHSSIANVAGLPGIAYHDASTFDLKYAALPVATWSASKGGAEPILASGVKDSGVTAAMLSGDIGIWQKSGDDLFHAGGRVGIGRLATANTLEVEGSASKSTAGSWAANSDRRIKTDIREIGGALGKIRAIRLVDFEYTPEYRAAHPGVEDRRYPNVIAQEFAAVFPDWVKGSGELLSDSSGDEILQVDTYPLTIYSAAALQELAEENERLRERLERLEKMVESLAAEKGQ
jgi:hypothetical protein